MFKSTLKTCSLIQVLFSASFLGQVPPPPNFKPDAVIATIDGRKVTYGELEGYLSVLTPSQKAHALSQPQELIKEYAAQLKMVALAEKDKLDQVSPNKEALEYSRRLILTQAELAYRTLQFVVSAEDQKNAYAAHKDRYTEVKLQIIYLSFTSDPVAKENPKKYRNEPQAKALATKLRETAKTSADFVRLAKQFSEDEDSKAKDGEYGTLKLSDNVPVEIKTVVFALKPGEISEPVRQQNGFYLFRAEAIRLRPYDDVKDEIYTELKNQGVGEWFAELRNNLSITLDNPEFFGINKKQ